MASLPGQPCTRPASCTPPGWAHCTPQGSWVDKCKVQKSRCREQSSKVKVRGARFKGQDTGSKVQRSRCREQGSKVKVQGVRFKVQGAESKTQSVRQAVPRGEDRLAKVVVGWQHLWDHLSTDLKMCSVKMWFVLHKQQTFCKQCCHQ